MPDKQQEIPIRQVINALLDDTNPFSPQYLHRFSDLNGADLSAVREAWPRVNPSRKVALMEDLEELVEIDTLVLFDNLARIALDDNEPGVRERAIRLLWENEDTDLIPTFMTALASDSSVEVRAAAASGLGKFVYLGEIEEIPSGMLTTIEEVLLKAEQSADETLVRRRALEALGFSSRDEVPSLIQAAYDSNDSDWIASALFAMGRSYDKAWEPAVRRMLNSPKANIQLEAVRAAGELELDSARRSLLDLLEEEAQDTEIRFAAIWSLSQIGGEQVRDTLEMILEETEDDEEAEWVENALDNLVLTETGESMGLLDIDLEDEEMLGSIHDDNQPTEDDEPLDDDDMSDQSYRNN